MKRTLVIGLLLLAHNAWAEEKVELRFVEVLEVVPKYVEVKCDPNMCQGTPDLRQVGMDLYYRCDGQLYQNWIPGRVDKGMLVQVANCENLVVSKRRKPVVKHPD